MFFVSIVWNLFLSFLALVVPVAMFYSLSVGYNKLKLKKPVALPLKAFSSGEILYTWEDWIRDNKEEFPVRYFLTETLPKGFRRVRYILSNLYQWVRTRTWRKFHILDVRNSEYTGGYRDLDTIMLYANFKILVDFVEKEMDGVFKEHIPSGMHEDWEITHFEHEIEIEQELKALYEWWTKDRMRWNFMFHERVEVEQQMLHRMIEIRPYLWT